MALWPGAEVEYHVLKGLLTLDWKIPGDLEVMPGNGKDLSGKKSRFLHPTFVYLKE